MFYNKGVRKILCCEKGNQEVFLAYFMAEIYSIKHLLNLALKNRKNTVLKTPHCDIVYSPDITVCGDVCVEVGWVSECLVAVRALVGRGRAVRGLVLLQVRLLTEPLLTHHTLKRPLSYKNTRCTKISIFFVVKN
jgi:hypothetical protein